jgi:DNA replication protein DnaC
MLMEHQLTPYLKRLKLSGILESLEVRHQQAIDEEWSYIDFLARLFEDEVERREQKKLSMRLRRAAVDTQKTIEAFDFRFNPTIKRSVLRDLATCEFVEAKRNVLIVGPAGVGKSHIAQALGHEACRRGHSVLFQPTHKLMAHIHAGRADGTFERRLANAVRVDVLILDDFGLKALNVHQVDILFDIIAERYERAPIIVTSNRDFAEWPALFGDPLLASAALDRLAHDARQLVIEGNSYRTSRRRRSNTSNPLDQGNPSETVATT